MPGVPLPNMAQLTAVIDAIEPTILQLLTLPLTWLRDRLDPLHSAEALEEQEAEEEEIRLSQEKTKERRAKRGAKGDAAKEAIAPGQDNSETTKKMSNAIGEGKKREGMERKRSSRGRKEIDLMRITYHHEKLNLPLGQRPYFTKNEKDGKKKEGFETQKLVGREGQGDHGNSEEEHDSQPTRRTSLDQKVGFETRQQQGQKTELPAAQMETMEVSTVEDHERPVKIRLYPEEEARVARELQEAMDTHFFKHWPVKHEIDPKINDQMKVHESTAFRAPLSDANQARKLELLKQWNAKEEKGSNARGRVKDRAEYEDDEMMDMLMTTSMFRPTLEPYIGSGKKIPTREEVLAEYESTMSVYEDAFEELPTATAPTSTNSRNTSKNYRKENDSRKNSTMPRTRRIAITKSDEDEEPAFAPKKYTR